MGKSADVLVDELKRDHVLFNNDILVGHIRALNTLMSSFALTENTTSRL